MGISWVFRDLALSSVGPLDSSKVAKLDSHFQASCEALTDDEVLEVYGLLHTLEAQVAARMKMLKSRVIEVTLSGGEQVSPATKRLDYSATRFAVTIATIQKVDEAQVTLLLVKKGIPAEMCFDRVERLVFNDKAFSRLVASGGVTAEDVLAVVTTTTSPRLTVTLSPVVA